jgi:hypothetical protein
VDHRILTDILRRHLHDRDILWLLGEIVGSFCSTAPGKGLPLGNLTSQLLVSVYMNEFDQFVKHELKAKYYIRYADDFVFLSHSRESLEKLVPRVDAFLQKRLKLTIHPLKLHLTTLASGIDFLGWVHFPDHRVLRTTTKRRMMKRIQESEKEATRESYLGMLRHGNAEKLRDKISHYGR